MKIKPKKILTYGLIGAAIVCALLLIEFLFNRPPHDKTLRGVAWFKFDKHNSLDGWEEKIFNGRVLYSVKDGSSKGYLNAYSQKAASGILRWVKFNPNKHPMISWKWKVVQFPQRKVGTFTDGSWVEKDDYAARFYVIFPRFPFFRLQCLEYVWDKDLPLGTVLNNPNFPNLKLIVASSGDQNLGKWISIERNVFEDFEKYFGKAPGYVGAIAIMTDADNTASTAEAQYNDIEVGYDKK